MGVTNKTDGLTGKAIVFLKTSEEAKCVAADNCSWNYTSTIPTVTSMTHAWDDVNQYWTVIVTGTSFTGNESTTELTVNGKS